MVSDKSINTNNQKIWKCEVSDLKKGMKGLEISGNPVTEKSPYGTAVVFNGINDGLFLAENPIDGLHCFTIEMLIRPYSDGPEEQRFLHIGNIDSDRLLIELRLTKENVWYLDTFILSGDNKTALIDHKLTHPVNEWHHVVMTLDKTGQMTNYVNGKKEMTGHVDFKPMTGEMSIGARRNKVSWYKGAISRIKISPEVLNPENFITHLL